MKSNSLKQISAKVDSKAWADLSQENRSQIIREAVNRKAGMKRTNDNVGKFATDLEEIETSMVELRTQKKVKRTLLHQELEDNDYEDYILTEDIDDSWPGYILTMAYASEYAKDYIEDSDLDNEEVTNKVGSALNDESRILETPILEWVVIKTREKIEG